MRGRNMTIGWKQLYQSALFEDNPDQVPKPIADARAAIGYRMAELASPTCGEHLAMKDPLHFLQLLQSAMIGVHEASPHVIFTDSSGASPA